MLPLLNNDIETATALKVLIADFVGVPYGRKLRTYMCAKKNIDTSRVLDESGEESSISNSACNSRKTGAADWIPSSSSSSSSSSASSSPR